MVMSSAIIRLTFINFGLEGVFVLFSKLFLNSGMLQIKDEIPPCGILTCNNYAKLSIFFVYINFR